MKQRNTAGAVTLIQGVLFLLVLAFWVVAWVGR
jgi:hypothetical protein